MRAKTTVASCLLAAAAFASYAEDAKAQVVIKNPNAHPDYAVELEPQGTFGLWHRGYGNYYRGRYSYDPFGRPEFGAGFRATIKIVDPGFIPKLNNVVGITFGLNITNCQFCRTDFSLYTPVGIQWRFWITEKFSTFADLGFILRTDGFYKEVYPDFFLMAGGSYHFNDDVAFTFRIGIPFVTLGASFFAGWPPLSPLLLLFFFPPLSLSTSPPGPLSLASLERGGDSREGRKSGEVDPSAKASAR